MASWMLKPLSRYIVGSGKALNSAQPRTFSFLVFSWSWSPLAVFATHAFIQKDKYSAQPAPL